MVPFFLGGVAWGWKTFECVFIMSNKYLEFIYLDMIKASLDKIINIKEKEVKQIPTTFFMLEFSLFTGYLGRSGLVTSICEFILKF